MSRKSKTAITAQELLNYSDDDLVTFMTQSQTTGRRYDISQIGDFNSISSTVRERLCQRIEKAAMNLNPLEADQLRQALDALQIAQRAKDTQGPDSEEEVQEDDERPSSARENGDRKRTTSPPSHIQDDDPAHREALAYDNLVLAGGLPLMAKGDLRPIREMTRQNLEKAACFVDVPKDAPDSLILPLFTSQLGHWTPFKQQWQWCNRGKGADRKGFLEFLELMKQEYLANGGREMVEAKDSFKGMARRKWEYERLGLETSNGRGLKTYARAVEKRLASHGFKPSQPLPLLADPRLQDKETTMAEYLNLVYWQLDKDAANMEKAEPLYRRAMEELILIKNEQPTLLGKSGTLEQQLADTREGLARLRERIDNISQEAAQYLEYQARVRRHKLRAKWILKELPSWGFPSSHTGIRNSSTSKMKMAHQTATENAVETRQSRKRKGRHYEDDPTPLKRPRILPGRESISITSTTGSTSFQRPRRSRKGIASSGEMAAPAAKGAADKLRRSRSRQDEKLDSGGGKSAANNLPADTTVAGARQTRGRGSRL